MRFNFIGELDFNDDDKKVPGFAEGKTKKGDPYAKANPIVIAAKNNRGFCEFFGVKSDVIKTIDTEGNPIEVKYEDREDEDVLNSVAFSRKFVVDDGEERKEFLSGYDFAIYLRDHVDSIKGKRVCVTGQTEKNEYKRNISDKFSKIQSVRVLGEDDERKNGLQLSAEIFFTKDGVDTADFKTEKKITLSGYTSEYVGKDDEGNYKYEYYDFRVIFDCSKVDFDNEKHVKIMNFRLKQMGLVYEDGKLVNNLKPKKVYSNMFILNLINGNEEIEFDESQLTAAQKEKIELGLATLDDFKPKGKIFGNSVKIYKVKDFALTGDYSEGLKVQDETIKEFEDKIHRVVNEEVEFTDLMKPSAEVEGNDEGAEDDDDDLGDLFD